MKKYFILNNSTDEKLSDLECDIINMITCFLFIFVIVLIILYVFGQNKYTIGSIIVLVLVGIFMQICIGSKTITNWNV